MWELFIDDYSTIHPTKESLDLVFTYRYYSLSNTKVLVCTHVHGGMCVCVSV